MFEKIRKPGQAKSLFAYIIFFFICLVFVFLGVPIGSMSDAGGFAALVDKEVVSIQQFRNRMDQMQSNSLQKSNANSQKDQSNLVISQLINEALMVSEAKKAGMLIADSAVRDEITTLSFLNEQGQFKQSLYQSFLNSRRMSAARFENQIRQWLIATRAESLFNKAFSVSSLEQKKHKELNQFQIQLKYVRIALPDDSAEEVKKWQDLLTSSKKLEKHLKNKKLQWIDGSTVSLKNWDQVIPASIDKNDLFEHFVQKIPKKGLIPKLFTDSDGVVIVYLKSFHTKTQNKKQSKSTLADLNNMDSFLSLAVSQMIFSSWIEFYKNQASIRINSKIL